MADQIVLEHVTKTFTTKELGSVTAVDDFNLAVKKGDRLLIAAERQLVVSGAATLVVCA